MKKIAALLTFATLSAGTAYALPTLAFNDGSALEAFSSGIYAAALGVVEPHTFAMLAGFCGLTVVMLRHRK